MNKIVHPLATGQDLTLALWAELGAFFDWHDSTTLERPGVLGLRMLYRVGMGNFIGESAVFRFSRGQCP